MTLLNISYPDTAMEVFKIIAQITRFNLIPMDQFINNYFSFEEMVPLNENFEMMGYQSKNLLQNLDTVLLFLLAVVLSMTLILMLELIIPL